jgi:hypothetical protein
MSTAAAHEKADAATTENKGSAELADSSTRSNIFLLLGR